MTYQLSCWPSWQQASRQHLEGTTTNPYKLTCWSAQRHAGRNHSQPYITGLGGGWGRGRAREAAGRDPGREVLHTVHLFRSPAEEGGEGEEVDPGSVEYSTQPFTGSAPPAPASSLTPPARPTLHTPICPEHTMGAAHSNHEAEKAARRRKARRREEEACRHEARCREEAVRREAEEARQREETAHRQAEEARQKGEAARRKAEEAHRKAEDARRREEEALNRSPSVVIVFPLLACLLLTSKGCREALSRALVV